MRISKDGVSKAIAAHNKYPLLARGRMPEVLDRVFHSIVGMREGIKAKWEPELMEYWYRDLGGALEQWRIVREEIEEEERERPFPFDDDVPQPHDRPVGS